MTGESKADEAALLTNLSYEPATGVFTWRYRVGVRATWNTRFAGKQAGALNGSGHRQIPINGKNLSANRIAWFMAYGIWPSKHIDHVNGNPDDNRLQNLREATNAENGWNSKLSVRNKSGFKGVSFYPTNGKYQATICANGKQRRIGFYDTFEEACAARASEARLVHGKFARVA